jgi:hypothetical protein
LLAKVGVRRARRAGTADELTKLAAAAPSAAPSI